MPLALCATSTEPSEQAPLAKRISVLAPPARNARGVMPSTSFAVA